MIRLEKFDIRFSKKEVLKGNFQARNGFITGIIGESGSGKSSLLNILSLYAYNQDFHYYLNDQDLSTFTESQLKSIMKQEIAYLRQDNPFLETMTCIENLRLESEISGLNCTHNELNDILKNVNLLNQKDKYPKNLSGGEKQRLAIAMAIAKNASIILCDEITSSLDNTNTDIILDILKDLAYNKGKLIVLASHERKVINMCDEIYQISEKQLIKIKTQNDVELNSSSALDRKPKPFKYISRIAFARIKKKKYLFALLWVIASLTIGLISYTTIWSIQNQSAINNILNNLVVNELFITNNVMKSTIAIHVENEPPIEQSVVEQLYEIEELKAIYPIQPIAILDTNHLGGSSVIQHLEEDEVISEVKIIDGSFYTSRFCIFPYFVEQRLHEVVENGFSHENGIYLDQTAANTFGFSEITEATKIRMDIYIPRSIKDTTIIKYTDTTSASYDVKMSSEFMQTTIELPVNGILPRSYLDSAVATSSTNMYIPYDDLMSLIKEATEGYELKEGEYLLEPNSYKVFLKDINDRVDVKNKILNISSSLLIGDTYEDYALIDEAIQNQKRFFTMSVAIVVGIAVILLIVYSVYHKKEAFSDYYFYNIRGLTHRERKWITLFETVIIFGCLFVISLIVTNILIINGIGDFRLTDIHLAAFQYEFVVILNLLLAFIFAILCESSLLFMKER